MTPFPYFTLDSLSLKKPRRVPEKACQRHNSLQVFQRRIEKMSIYPSDLNDLQWNIITSLIPKEKPGGRPRSTSMRAVVNALLYMNRTGCQWRFLPTEFPPRSTVFDYFDQWKINKIWDKIVDNLRKQVRVKVRKKSNANCRNY